MAALFGLFIFSVLVMLWAAKGDIAERIYDYWFQGSERNRKFPELYLHSPIVSGEDAVKNKNSGTKVTTKVKTTKSRPNSLTLDEIVDRYDGRASTKDLEEDEALDRLDKRRERWHYENSLEYRMQLRPDEEPF